MTRSFTRILLLIGLSLIVMTPSRSDEIYGRADVGVAINDFEINGTETVGTTSARFQFGSSDDLVGRYGGALGYRLDLARSVVAFEAEASYREISIDSGVLAGASFDADASGFIVPVLFNVRYEYKAGEKWRPFVMAGVGPTWIDPGTDGLDGNVTGLAYQFGAGANVDVYKGIRLEGSYRYIDVSKSDSFRDGASTVDYDLDQSAHEISVGLSIPFWSSERSATRGRAALEPAAPLPPRQERIMEPARARSDIRTVPPEPAPMAQPSQQARSSYDAAAATLERHSSGLSEPAPAPPTQTARPQGRPQGLNSASTTRLAPRGRDPVVPSPAATAPVASSGARHWVQLAAFNRSDRAEAGLATLQSRYGQFLTGGQPRIVEGYNEMMGATVYRVQFGPYDRTRADQICQAVDPCLVK